MRLDLIALIVVVGLSIMGIFFYAAIFTSSLTQTPVIGVLGILIIIFGVLIMAAVIHQRVSSSEDAKYEKINGHDTCSGRDD